MKITKKRLFDFCNENNDALNDLQSQSDSTDFVLSTLIDQLKDLGVIDKLGDEPSEPKLKQLDQSVFDGLEENWRFAAVDGCTGRAYVYEQKPHFFHGKDYWRIHEGLQRIISHDYDASNWQNSLIERDLAKELLEVDLSSELTGSDLTRSILSKQFMQACLVSDSSDKAARQGDDLQLIRMYNETDGKFISMRDPWHGCHHKYAVAVDNNRKPLTAVDVGL